MSCGITFFLKAFYLCVTMSAGLYQSSGGSLRGVETTRYANVRGCVWYNAVMRQIKSMDRSSGAGRVSILYTLLAALLLRFCAAN